MRSAPKNFTPQALAEGAAFAHARGKKLYVTLNTVPTNEELSALPAFLQQAQAAGADAFIVADWGVLRCIRQCTPQMPVHVSTQAAWPTGARPALRTSWAQSGWCWRASFPSKR